MTVFTLAFGGPDAAWMYACIVAVAYNAGAGLWAEWLGNQCWSGCLRVRCKEWGSWLLRWRCTVHDVTVRWADKMCSAAVRELAPVGIFATWLVSKNTRDQSFETKSMTKTGNAETKTKTGSVNTKTKTAKKRSRVVSRPRPRSRGLHHWLIMQTFYRICLLWAWSYLFVVLMTAAAVNSSELLNGKMSYL